jgi:hypothetical protein
MVILHAPGFLCRFAVRQKAWTKRFLAFIPAKRANIAGR